MGAIGFGAGVRPPGAGRATTRRIRGFGAAEAAPPGGGDIRRMRNVGGYSTVGFRAIPPIGRKPAPDADAEAEADALTDAVLARADEVLAQADELLAYAGEEAYAESGSAGAQTPPAPTGDELAGAGASR
ncbi:hypothetical protein IU471_11105 [Nocardia elegans]|uniref:Uncharacterized protein n=1 Tax=Nocardia elegans TaxID=300029 RepID=A0ABW6TC85_9NOCA|nr:hypothetical protein [Nocardia elegans]MBF6244126.1 hypothetical protein [Nocardia elegans]MBF6448217.1 hypothetical protein [Nocardia elegans]